MVSYLKPNVFVVDLANNVAGIPGDGNIPVTFINTFDLAKYVLVILSLDEWPEESQAIGEELTWNDFALAERVKGLQNISPSYHLRLRANSSQERISMYTTPVLIN